jgi:peroxiredoxin family protein
MLLGKTPAEALNTMSEHASNNAKRMSMIVTKGSLDWAYPPFILATTAAAMGLEVSMFFTFYGLTLLKKKLNLHISTLGNPAMQMPMFGMHIGMPNLVSALPGVDAAATAMMKNLIKRKGVASIEELRAAAVESEVKMIACQMTMDLFEFSKDDLIEGPVLGGAATYIETAMKSDINLFI